MSQDNEFTDPEFVDDTSMVGETSVAGGGEIIQDDVPRRSWLDMGLFDVMLLIAFVLITLASMLMLWELSKFGSVFSLPWNA